MTDEAELSCGGGGGGGGGEESTVSVVISGDEAVRYPMCELCAESVGRIGLCGL